MTEVQPGAGQAPTAPAPSAQDVRAIATAIEQGWVGRGFKLGIGFFLAGLVIWLLPMMLLVSCVGGLAAMTAASGAGGIAEAAKALKDLDVEVTDSDGQTVRVQPANPKDRADAEAAANAATADTAAAGTQ